MKALSLWQPWASLIALGAKSIETRPWSTRYRGPLAIHASVRLTGWGRARTHTRIESGGCDSGFTVERSPDGLMLRGPHLAWPYRLPVGSIVAVAQLVDCIEMTEATIDATANAERAVGLFEPGRFMWVLEGVLPVAPVRCLGRQGLFNLPADLAARFAPTGEVRHAA